MVGHGDPDDPRAYLAVEVALPAPAPTSGSEWRRPEQRSRRHVVNPGVACPGPAAGSPGSAMLALLPAIMAMEGRNRSVYKSNKGGWQSVPDLLDHRWSVPALAELEAVLHTGISAFLQRGGAGSVLEREATGAVLDTEIHEAWVGINRPGNSNTVHLHPGSHISGVFYVSVPGGGGGGASGVRLTLHDPRGPVSPSLGGPFSIDPGDGDPVVFPSWLARGVPSSWSTVPGSGRRCVLTASLRCPPRHSRPTCTPRLARPTAEDTTRTPTTNVLWMGFLRTGPGRTATLGYSASRA